MQKTKCSLQLVLIIVGISFIFSYSAVAAGRNVLLLIADDIGVESSSFYPTSARRVTTPPAPPAPQLSALARKGVLFTSAWSSPLCSPTRATIFTGRYGFRTGVGTNPNTAGVPSLRIGEVILPEVFNGNAAARYVLGAVGKWHVSPGIADPNRYGWPYFAGGLPQRSGLELYNRWTKVINGRQLPQRTSVNATTDQVNEAIALIRSAKAASRPYFVQVAFNAAHNPYHVPPLNLHSRDTLPPFTNDRAKRPYFEAMIEALDSEIGRLLREVNLADTTVIFVGDNGTAQPVLPPPYVAAKGKGTLYESGIRVPLLIAGAGVASPGRTVGGPVNTVDLFPTVLALANLPAPAGVRLDGISLLPYLQNSSTGTRRGWAYAEVFSGSSFQRAIRDARYKLIERSSGNREFFDLSVDSLETKNLLTTTLTSSQQASLRTLDQQLDTLLASH